VNPNGIHWIRDSLRRAIIEIRDKRTCRYCGRRIGRRAQACLNHAIPRHLWGTKGWGGSPHQPRNLVTCCHRCNSEKRDRIPDEYESFLRTWGNETKAERVVEAWLEVSLFGDVTPEMRRRAK